MNAKDIRNIQEAYQAVYAPQELTEEVKIATEYFYEMGLNEHGIDILIEELGVEEFVEWVDEIAEQSTLTEARAAKKRTGGKSYAEIKAEIDAKEAAKAKVRKPAVTAAQTKQPETKSTPTQAKQGIGARIGAALKSAGERAKQDTALLGKSIQTARDVATQRGAEAKAVYDALRERGKKAEQSPEATRARRKATVALGRGAQAAGRTAIKAAGAAGAAAGEGLKAKRQGKTGAQIAGRVAGTLVKKMTKEEYDYILSHLLDEGYANDSHGAEVILMNMSENWASEILDETKRTEYLQKKFNKENQRKSGSAHTYIPGKQNTGQALHKARESERHMRGEK